MKGWILYRKKLSEITYRDNGVKRLLKAAKAKNIDLEVHSPEQFDLLVTTERNHTMLLDGYRINVPDFVLPRMGSHSTYQTLAVIREFERRGIYCCNSSRAIEIAKDKLQLHQLLVQNNLPTPKTLLLTFPINLSLIKQEISFPLIIKKITGMEGYGVYLCESAENFQDVIELFEKDQYQSIFLLQEFIADSRGKDLRVFILGDQVIGCMKRYSETSFKANFSRGGKVESFQLSPEIEWLALETAKLAGLEIAGIDLLFDKNGYKICEANSSPGFRGLELVVGETIAEQILEYMVAKIKKI